MSTPRPDSQAVSRARQLLEPAVPEPNEDRGFLDLLAGDPEPTSRGIQGMWLSRSGSAAYDRAIEGAGELARRVPGTVGRSLRSHMDLARRLELRGGETVLDLGCGPGNLTRRLAAEVGPEGLVLGVDISATMLARAVTAPTPDQVVYLRADATVPPVREACVHAVCCSLMLQLLDDPEAVLRRAYRVLVPGGRIAVAVPGAGPRAAERAASVLERVGRVQLFQKRRLAIGLRDAGFTEVTDFSGVLIQAASAVKPG